jgi:hypothetical protein
MVTQARVDPGLSYSAPAPRRRKGGGLVLFLCLLLVAGAAGWVYWHGSVANLPIREHCTATGDGSSVDLDPEQMGNAAIIAGVAVRRGLPGRAATIAIATAIQESKLRNINYGDRDSLGLFQQRPSMGWGTPDQLRDPVYASNAFYDVLVKIEGYRNLEITQAAQKVQRSAYPDAYADHEPEARVLASALAGYTAAGVTCVLRPTAATGQAPAKGGLTPRAAALVTAAGADTGRAAAGPVGPAGTTVQWKLTGKESGRQGWALAQWAVSRAQALGVVSVSTDGRRWSRDDPGGGWKVIEDQGADKKPATGTVLVQVAG